MASKRMIAADIWRDEFIGELSLIARVLWIGLIVTCADDQGRLVNNPTLIRSDVFPFDDVSITDIKNLIHKFSTAERIYCYKAGGKDLIQIVNWWEYQTPSWASPSKFSPPSDWTDREKYHTVGNKIVSRNWDKTGGYSILSNDLPSELDSMLPSGIEERRGEERSLTGAEAPKDPPAEEEPAPAPSIIKNQGAYNALLAHEKSRANGKPDVSWLSEHLRPLAEMFITESSIVPLKGEHKFWIRSIGNLYDIGAKPDHIKKAIRKMRGDGLTIKSPESCLANIRDELARSVQPDNINWK